MRLAKRLSVLEQQRRKAAKEPIRVIFQSVCGEPNLANSYFKRTLHPDGTLVEMVFLDGAINDADMEALIASLPIERIQSATPCFGNLPRPIGETIGLAQVVRP